MGILLGHGAETPLDRAHGIKHIRRVEGALAIVTTTQQELESSVNARTRHNLRLVVSDLIAVKLVVHSLHQLGCAAILA